ncbi:MAG: cyclase family protein [Rhodospirillales bacterium]|nr:cyclase family protein [Rhodospirillales bacterium]
MQSIEDPYSGLHLVELSHVWGHGAPSMPGEPDAVLFRSVKHAEHGVMAHRLKMVMHQGTHMNAPIHLVQRGATMGEIGLEHLFGNGVILSIPKEPWGQVTAEDLSSASPEIQRGDFVVIVTGWHHKYSDSLEYFGESPGLSKDGAEWLVDQGVMLVGMDTPQIDHPLATSLGNHRNGPIMNRVVALYEERTGRDAAKDFPDWNIAHKTLLAAGIPTVEQVGGDVDGLLGKRATFQAAPWNWDKGDACPVRFVAIIDPTGAARVATGEAA